MNTEDNITGGSKEILEARAKRVEIIGKINEIRANKVKYAQEQDERELKNEELTLKNEQARATGKSVNLFSPLFALVITAEAFMIDNDKTVIGGEPVLKSIWNEKELEIIKKKILEKVKEI